MRDGTKIYTSGQERDALWHQARAGLITSRSAYSLINATASLRLSMLSKHHWILSFLGFADFLPYEPCPLSLAQIDAIRTKIQLFDLMKLYGCQPLNSYQKSKVPELKAQFKAFLTNPPPAPTEIDIWKKLGPILLSSMMMKPLDNTKIQSLRLGIQNESSVVLRLVKDLNERFLGPSWKANTVYRIGLSAEPSAARMRMASSPDAMINLTSYPEARSTVPSEVMACVEIKSAVTHATSTALDSLLTVANPFEYIEFVNAELSSIQEVEEEIAGDETNMSVFAMRKQRFETCVSDITHRTQILHHCASLGINHVLYFRANLKQTKYVRLIYFPDEIINRYRALIGKILKVIAYHDFAQNLPQYPQTLASREAGHKLELLRNPSKPREFYRDPFSVAQTFAIGSLIRSQTETPPCCYRIKPAKYHLWNFIKSHDDASSEAKQRIAGNFSTEVGAYLTIRLLDSQILNALRVERALLRRHQLSRYESLSKYRRLLSRTPTLREFLIQSVNSFARTYRFNLPSLQSAGSTLPCRYSYFSQLSPCLRDRLSTVAYLEFPSVCQEVWKQFIHPHFPVRLTGSPHCALPGCQGRPSYGCPKCNLPLCFGFGSRNINACWLELHNFLFSGQLDSFFQRSLLRRKRTLPDLVE